MTTLGLGLLLLFAAIAILILAAKRKTADQGSRRAREENGRLVHELGFAQSRVVALSKYSTIENVEAHAAALWAQAQQASTELRETTNHGAEDKVRRADLEAKRLVDDAQKKAEAIAGNAYAALANVHELEETARAMQNVIEGYGDRYLIPTFSLLDELADEFGFAEGGQRLKQAREHMRQMIRNGTAAACDYVQDTHKTTAIDFVLDAFNGKVDSILADVRHNNFGTLQQKIKDAYSLVNKNGQAFRNARITPEFLQARIEELRWAVVVQELKLKEREEQRAIKERIRDEERAQRDFERAQKEAEKEEDMLRKAMEKAQREFDRASDEQKAKYEEQLIALAEQLRSAEEKNQRALSMAQQTKAGHVYIISNIGSFGDDVFKIGMTRRLEPQERIRELGDASVPFDFDVHALIRCDDAPALERELHKQFLRHQVNKVNPRKEFFRVRLQDVRREVERLGGQAAWTMSAECRHYRETQAIERAMANKSFETKKWAEQQLREHDVPLSETSAVTEAEA